MRRRVALTLLLAALAGCRSSSSEPPSAGVDIELTGAGATFPALLYTRWIAAYSQSHSEAQVFYEAIGSSAGLRALREGRVDFAGTEAWPDPERGADGDLLAIPVTLGAVAIGYNLPDVSGTLRLTPELVVAIFSGEIRRWNDGALRAVNPGLGLPDLPIQVIKRRDGSGTTAVFTAYLAAVSPSWRARIGAGSLVQFPVGHAALGNEGVAGGIKSTRGAIGYLQLAHARRVDMQLAAVRNRAGHFVTPSLETIASAARHPNRSRKAEEGLRLVDAAGWDSYPIAGYSYLVVHRRHSDAASGRGLAAFVSWCVHEGQSWAPMHDHAPLPPETVALAERRIRALEIDGKPVVP